MAASLNEVEILGAADVEAHARDPRAKQTAQECLAYQAEPNHAYRLCHEPHSALVVPAIAAFTLSQGPVRRTSTERRDGKFARGRVKTLAQRLGYGDAVLRAVLPLAMALLSGQPDAFDPGQSLGAAHDAHR